MANRMASYPTPWPQPGQGGEMIPATLIHEYTYQDNLRQFETVHVPPFTWFFRRGPSDWSACFSMPDKPVGSDVTAPLAELRRRHAAEGRQVRIEYLEASAPELAASLEAAGLVQHAR